MRSRSAVLLLLVVTLLNSFSAALADNSRRRSATAVEEISGIVVRLAGESLTARTNHGDRDLRAGSSTTIIVQGRKATLSLVRIGDQVEGTVRKGADGTYTVVRLVVGDDHSRVEFEGTVQSVSPGFLVLRTGTRDFSIAVTGQTLVYVDGRPVAASAIVAGARVEIEAQRRADGTYEALLVKLNSAVVEVEGTVTAVTATSLTIRTEDGRAVVIGLTPATIILVHDRPASLQLGMHAEIDAIRNGDGSLTAVRIEAEDDQHLEKIQGVITAITKESIRVLTRAGVERTIVVPADTVIRMDDRLIPLSTLKVGDQVRVDARRTGDTLTAVRIEIEEAESGEVSKVEGVVTSITGSLLKVRAEHGEVVVLLSADTVIRRHDQVVPLSTLQVGDKVEVKGRRNADGSFQAVAIQIQEREEDHSSDESVKIEGSITTVTSSSITVLTTSNTTSVTLAITSETLIRKDDHPLTATDLKVGQRVEIRARRNPDGSYIALSIEVD